MISLATSIRRFSLVAILSLFLIVSPVWAAKNVIIMVSDGAGYNSWLAASMYQGKVGKQVYDRPGWLKVFEHDLSAESVRPRRPATSSKKHSLVYDPSKAWDATQTGSKPGDCPAMPI